MTSLADSYRGYIDLAAAQTEGADYRVVVRSNVSSPIAIIAPHGGRIEQYTSNIACGVGGTDFNLYLFEGIRQAGNYAALHLTSHRFDEPRCLSLLSNCDYVVAIHGCSGYHHSVLIGGRDEPLKLAIGQALAARGIEVRHNGHPFPATDPNNICNRGRRGLGVQVEMTMGLRQHGPRDVVCAAIRSVLLKLPNDQREDRANDSDRQRNQDRSAE